MMIFNLGDNGTGNVPGKLPEMLNSATVSYILPVLARLKALIL